jgi:hypothetical protein
MPNGNILAGSVMMRMANQFFRFDFIKFSSTMRQMTQTPRRTFILLVQMHVQLRQVNQ